MAGSLPTVRSGASCLYPLTRHWEYSTSIHQFCNSTEHRWKKRSPLARFVLQYVDLNVTDRGNIETFFNSQKGAFDSTWSLTLPAPVSLTFSNLCFEDDMLRFEERKSMLFSTTLRCRQTQNRAFATPSVSAVFPAVLMSGATCQLPYVRIRKFLTAKNDSLAGPRYAWDWYNAGLTGFPTRALLAWELNFPSLKDSELATLETFFKSVNGSWGQFQFTDPEGGTVYTKCRFGSDLLEVRHIGPNQSSLILTIVETN